MLELPGGAELLASSQTAPYEIWSFQDRVLAIQGHPEMVPEDMLQKIWPFLSSNRCVAELPWSPHGSLPWEIVDLCTLMIWLRLCRHPYTCPAESACSDE